MEHLVLIGVNHKTAPLALRERFALPEGELGRAAQALRVQPGIREALLLSTCNRVEVYAVAAGASAEDLLLGRLAAQGGLSREALVAHHYRHRGAAAAAHLIRVAAGLDSLVLGDAHVGGQVKRAYLSARAAGTCGRVLHHVFQHGLAAARRVRGRTDAARGARSVSDAAVELVRARAAPLSARTLLLLGAGQVAEATLERLRGEPVRRLIIISRDDERARRLAARFGAETAPLGSLAAILPAADVLITQAAAPGVVVEYEMLERALQERDGRSMLIVDVGVPRNVAHEAGGIRGASLYTVDDLQTSTAHGADQRADALADAQALVAREAGDIMAGLAMLDLGDTIRDLRRRADAIKADELHRTRRRRPALGEEELADLTELAERLTRRLLHEEMAVLRALVQAAPGRQALEEP